jgi:predicted secreted protein
MVGNILHFILIYVVMWWLVLFMVLPFRAHPPAKPGKGHASSAPEKAHFAMKCLVTSIISLLFTLGIVYYLRHNGLY